MTKILLPKLSPHLQSCVKDMIVLLECVCFRLAAKGIAKRHY